MNGNAVVKTLCVAILALACLTTEAMPTRAELKQVQSAVNELMADDIAAMKSGKMKPTEVARNAEKLAGEATDEASKFLFYKGAFGLHVQGGSYDEAVKALEKLRRDVQNVPDKVMAEIVRDKLKRISRKNGGVIFDLYDRLDRRARFAGEIAELEKKAKSSPSDKDIRRQLAMARVQIGAWPDALKDFSALGGKEATAVNNEKKNPAMAADFWWNYATEEDFQDAFREHAAGLYRQAIAKGSLKGIQLSLAKKRMQEYETAQPATTADESKVAKAEEKEGEAETSKTEPPKKINMAGLPKPITIPLKGKGVRPLTFVPVPAGEMHWGEMEKGKNSRVDVTITRPFLVAQLPIDYAQWEAVMGSREGRDAFLERDKGKEGILFRALGGAKSVAVASHYAKAESFLMQLDKKFKRYLPKGMVFRFPTWMETEYFRCCGQTDRILTFDVYSNDHVPDWVVKGHFRIADAVAALKKAGVKLPDVDAKEPDRVVSPTLGDWTGVFRMERCFPTGQKAPNAFGIYDANMRSICLDRLSSRELLPEGSDDMKNFFDWNIVLSDCLDEKDGFFWTEDKKYQTICRSSWNWWTQDPYMGGLGDSIRVVIGPDLVSEWKAKHKK